MCGVFGYVGKPTAVIPMVANALRVMEYRGYDSWGIGWDEGTRVQLVKRAGRVPQELAEDVTASIAIGHTRWATHGGVTDTNAHPHTDEAGQLAVVHNGVIENAAELKATYLPDVPFRSETDSEIVPHLIRMYLDRGASFTEAVRRTFLMLEGSSAVLAMDRTSNVMVAVTARSPLRLGRRTDGWELASDPLAFAKSSHEIAVIPDHHLVILTPDTAQLVDLHAGSEVAISWQPTPEEMHSSRGEFSHFTLKEIHDQPEVARILAACAADVSPLAQAVQKAKHVLLTGCGSALYAASLGATWLQQATDAWVDVVPASEISDSTRHLGTDTLVIALTQSGETADVVDAIQLARRWDATIATIINTETSTVASLADIVVPIKAGVERSVLATKSFLAMAIRLIQTSAWLDPENDSDLDETTRAIDAVLTNPELPRIANAIAMQDSMIVLGKGAGRAVAQEAALKIKEGSYLHAEAFLSGELKHGPLALVQQGTPCLVFATTAEELQSARIAAAEVMCRGGYVVAMGEFDPNECSVAVPLSSSGGSASLVHLVASQVLAFHIALARGVDPDFPRNLAKSVTVR